MFCLIALLSCTCVVRKTAFFPCRGKGPFHRDRIGVSFRAWLVTNATAAIAHPLCLQSVTGKSTHSGQETQSELFKIPTDQAPNTPVQRPPGLGRQSPSPSEYQLNKKVGQKTLHWVCREQKRKNKVGVELHEVRPKSVRKELEGLRECAASEGRAAGPHLEHC